jgi:FkbM family methyltransferase
MCTVRRPPVSRLSRRELQRSVKLARRSVFERCGSRRYSKPALNRLDDLLLEHLPEGEGFFVEAGANDGYTQSNTYYLERYRGWRGLLVEPTPHLARVCRRVRKASAVVECALVAPTEAGGTVRLRYADLMSVTEGARGDAEADGRWVGAGRSLLRVPDVTYEVPATTLGSLLDEVAPACVDLLSLDVEGYELKVLAGLGAWRPTWILVESHDQEGLQRMLGREYEVVARPTPLDMLLRRRLTAEPGSLRGSSAEVPSGW